MKVNFQCKKVLLRWLFTAWLLPVALLFTSLAKAQNELYLTLPTHFSRVGNFHGGRSRVETFAGSIGYLDTTRHYQIFPSQDFDVAGDFKNGYAWVGKYIGDSCLYGFVDTAGKTVIDLKYTKVEPFYNHRANVYSNQNGWQVIDTAGRVVLSDSLLITKEPVWAAGEIQAWQDKQPPHFQQGLMLCYQGGKYGYVDSLGQLVIPCQYLRATGFSGGVALVARDTVASWSPAADKPAGEKLAALDRLYIDLQAGPVTYKWALINTRGDIISTIDSSLRPDISRGFTEGLLAFQDPQNKWGFMDTQAKVVIAARFDNEPGRFSDGVCIVQVAGHQLGGKDGYMLLFDLTGKQVAKIPFCTAAGCMYDSHLAYHEGLLAVKIGHYWGYMDKKGRLVIPPKFESAFDFHYGRAVVVDQRGQLKVLLNPLSNSLK